MFLRTKVSTLMLGCAVLAFLLLQVCQGEQQQEPQAMTGWNSLRGGGDDDLGREVSPAEGGRVLRKKKKTSGRRSTSRKPRSSLKTKLQKLKNATALARSELKSKKAEKKKKKAEKRSKKKVEKNEVCSRIVPEAQEEWSEWATTNTTFKVDVLLEKLDSELKEGKRCKRNDWNCRLSKCNKVCKCLGKPEDCKKTCKVTLKKKKKVEKNKFCSRIVPKAEAEWAAKKIASSDLKGKVEVLLEKLDSELKEGKRCKGNNWNCRFSKCNKACKCLGKPKGCHKTCKNIINNWQEPMAIQEYEAAEAIVEYDKQFVDGECELPSKNPLKHIDMALSNLTTYLDSDDYYDRTLLALENVNVSIWRSTKVNHDFLEEACHPTPSPTPAPTNATYGDTTGTGPTTRKKGYETKPGETFVAEPSPTASPTTPFPTTLSPTITPLSSEDCVLIAKTSEAACFQFNCSGYKGSEPIWDAAAKEAVKRLKEVGANWDSKLKSESSWKPKTGQMFPHKEATASCRRNDGGLKFWNHEERKCWNHPTGVISGKQCIYYRGSHSRSRQLFVNCHHNEDGSFRFKCKFRKCNRLCNSDYFKGRGKYQRFGGKMKCRNKCREMYDLASQSLSDREVEDKFWADEKKRASMGHAKTALAYAQCAIAIFKDTRNSVNATDGDATTAVKSDIPNLMVQVFDSRNATVPMGNTTGPMVDATASPEEMKAAQDMGIPKACVDSLFYHKLNLTEDEPSLTYLLEQAAASIESHFKDVEDRRKAKCPSDGPPCTNSGGKLESMFERAETEYAGVIGDLQKRLEDAGMNSNLPEWFTNSKTGTKIKELTGRGQTLYDWSKGKLLGWSKKGPREKLFQKGRFKSFFSGSSSLDDKVESGKKLVKKGKNLVSSLFSSFKSSSRDGDESSEQDLNEYSAPDDEDDASDDSEDDPSSDEDEEEEEDLNELYTPINSESFSEEDAW